MKRFIREYFQYLRIGVLIWLVLITLFLISFFFAGILAHFMVQGIH